MSVMFLAAALAVSAPPVLTPNATPAPFSQAAQMGDVLYLAGQLGNGPDGKLAIGMEGQARQAMDNVKRIVEAHGRTMDDVFKCTVMMGDMKQWGDFNKIYLTYFKPARLPARSAFGANGLAGGALLEVECWAYSPAGPGTPAAPAAPTTDKQVFPKDE